MKRIKHNLTVFLLMFVSVSNAQNKYQCFEEKLDTNFISEFKRIADVPQVVKDSVNKYMYTREAGYYKWFSRIKKSDSPKWIQRSIGHVLEYHDYYVVTYYRWEPRASSTKGIVIYKNAPMKEFNLKGDYGYFKLHSAKEMILALNNYDSLIRCEPSVRK